MSTPNPIQNYIQFWNKYSIEQLINELRQNKITVLFANNANLNLVKSTLKTKVDTIKTSEPINSYKLNHIIFRKRAGVSSKDSLCIYWDSLRLYSFFDNFTIETYGSFHSTDFQNLHTAILLMETIKYRWNEIVN